ncbi:major_cap_HK97, phage major capsid protein, HK97 family [uncultured Caudovirales phage]|uniref:Major_cap_HK97, phage major capsid protein, HK97 family n=1 Tax=uncultured Caudovirales phage TaxID=2100421 RepID=A0A6J5PZJ1_9CAUD|nr:major_cap_HK97, phage major capsid protein, HK97 family [uncultured Caudovirales phage]CAB4199284.1 major_cap_HK97, phage major capsid protein, HK97 family [uncultured Caudovirales phage]CAB4212997.1 major_cap_HK97, phage major capsid protein, HK97 family [uncultured Caudovirales phage]CAB5227961.1 major_cap_HK97, phage major capsid protein, HK97 family [uncultured Caudovirales phage]
MKFLFTVMPILVAVACANNTVGMRLASGFHVPFKANRQRVGFTKLAPWLQRAADVVVTAPAAVLATVVAFLRARPNLVGATLMLALSLAHPLPADAMAFAMVGVAGTLGTNIDAMERDLVGLKSKASGLLEKHSQTAEAHVEKVGDKEVKGRVMSKAETDEIQAACDAVHAQEELIARAKSQQGLADQIHKMTAGMSSRRADEPTRAAERRSLGQQFVQSEIGKFFKDGRHRTAGQFSSPSVELFAATLTTDTASGGDLITPDYRPGILPLLFKRLTVRDLLAPGSTASNVIKYMKETTFTNAAATVAEGAARAESTLVFDLVSDDVKEIGHWLPVTGEMVEDVPQIQSYIDARLNLGVELTEEDQLLNGDGTGTSLTGLMNRSGLTSAQARSSDTNIDAIYKCMMNIFNASFVMPEGHIINPANWQTIQLSKDSQGQYLGSGPWAPAQSQVLWGLPVAVTPSIVANTSLTGAFRSCAQIFDKGGIRVEATNSHADFFVKRLIAIMANRRLALAVYRPAAFAKTTGLN